jgi:5-methylcytosine-specific restriction protein A
MAPPIWKRWYGLERWRQRARGQLMLEPLCRICEIKGKVTAASIADHITPHRGDPRLFWEGKLQSLCPACHSGLKRQTERRGYSTEVGPDGYPTDHRHPWYQGRLPARRSNST